MHPTIRAISRLRRKTFREKTNRIGLEFSLYEVLGLPNSVRERIMVRSTSLLRIEVGRPVSSLIEPNTGAQRAIDNADSSGDTPPEEYRCPRGRGLL